MTDTVEPVVEPRDKSGEWGRIVPHVNVSPETCYSLLITDTDITDLRCQASTVKRTRSRHVGYTISGLCIPINLNVNINLFKILS